MDAISKAMCDCKYAANQITEDASAAYWLHHYAPDAVHFRVAHVHEQFRAIAKALGYIVTSDSDIRAEDWENAAHALLWEQGHQDLFDALRSKAGEEAAERNPAPDKAAA